MVVAATRYRRENEMTVERPWLAQYPAGIPAQIDADEFSSIPAVLEGSIRKFRDRPAFTNMGKTLTYAQIDELSRQFAAYLLGRSEEHTSELQSLMRISYAVFCLKKKKKKKTKNSNLQTKHKHR